MTLHIFI